MMDKTIFDVNFSDYQTIKDLYGSFEDFVALFLTTDKDYNYGVEYEDEVVKYLALCIYDFFLSDQIAYLDIEPFEKRMNNTLREVYPMLAKKYEFHKNLVASGTTEADFISTGGMSSVRTGDVKVNSDNFQKSANTPTKITPTDTTDFTASYTNFQGKSTGENVSEESASSNIKRYGSTEELFKLFGKLPRSLYNEVCELFTQHFVFIY